MIERLVGGALHCFLQLDVRLGLVQDLTPTGDVLHQMFVQRMDDSHPADECESGDIFAALVHFSQLAREEANVRLETARRPHLTERR